MGNIIQISSYLQERKQGGANMCAILEAIRGRTPNELLEIYNMNIAPPIDLAQLLQKIGISTIVKDFSEMEASKGMDHGSILGAAISNGDNLTIFYRQKDNFHRRKFTIAHELAHCCLHCPENRSSHIQYRLKPFVNLTEKELEKEREANIFAGELLIPEDILMKYYKQMIVPSLTSLAEIFDVSTSVMAARLDYLNLAYYKDSKTEIIY